MSSQWDNFLRNLGEWRGSFASLDATGAVVEETPSILTLERGEEERLVHFRLRRFADGDLNGEPSRDMSEDYRNLGRQVVFFESGTFCKGRLQVAPGTPFGGEFGFIDGDRRHRLVQLHNDDGTFANLVLIREFRAGSDAQERPALTLDQLQGSWSGNAATITADWPEPDQADCRFEVSGSDEGTLRIQTSSGASRDSVEAGRSDPQLQLTWLSPHPAPRGSPHCVFGGGRMAHRSGSTGAADPPL
jgi:hypothetical protein